MAFMRSPLYILMQDGQVKLYATWSESKNPVKTGGDMFLTQDLFDEIIMMRYYNMTEEERRAAIERVLYTQFETGADGVRKASGLPTTMERVEVIVSERVTITNDPESRAG